MLLPLVIHRLGVSVAITFCLLSSCGFTTLCVRFLHSTIGCLVTSILIGIRHARAAASITNPPSPSISEHHSSHLTVFLTRGVGSKNPRESLVAVPHVAPASSSTRSPLVASPIDTCHLPDNTPSFSALHCVSSFASQRPFLAGSGAMASPVLCRPHIEVGSK